MSIDLNGKVAVVTGAGRGIGRAHATLLASRGAAVVVADVGAELNGTGESTSVADEVVAAITASGGRAVAAYDDIATFEGGGAVVQRALDVFGRVDIVVNNAGMGRGGGLTDITEADLAKVFAVNYTGTLATIRAAWPHLIAQGWGRIVNTVSEVALDTKIGNGGGVAYGPAKAAVWSLTLSLAQQARDTGITVNAISPGAFTRMNAGMFSQQSPPPGLDLDPMHVARVALWLCSDEAADVTGRIIHAAGGQHREYITARERSTPLMDRVNAAAARLVAGEAS
ncbi:MAG: SDR family NAD(P)-dependent oxidoreductase [Acidimicrobiia bacterium]